MQARMKNPVMILPDAMKALFALDRVTERDDLPNVTGKLVHLRASQINGCSVCVEMHDRERIVAVPFPDAVDRAMERLALVEKRKLLVVGAKVGETDAEEPDGGAARSRLFEEVANHRIKLELRAGGGDGARTLEGLEIG